MVLILAAAGDKEFMVGAFDPAHATVLRRKRNAINREEIKVVSELNCPIRHVPGHEVLEDKTHALCGFRPTEIQRSKIKLAQLLRSSSLIERNEDAMSSRICNCLAIGRKRGGMARDLCNSTERPTISGNDPKSGFFFSSIAPQNQEFFGIRRNILKRSLGKRCGDVGDGTATNTYSGELNLAVRKLGEV